MVVCWGGDQYTTQARAGSSARMWQPDSPGIDVLKNLGRSIRADIEWFGIGSQGARKVLENVCTHALKRYVGETHDALVGYALQKLKWLAFECRACALCIKQRFRRAVLVRNRENLYPNFHGANIGTDRRAVRRGDGVAVGVSEGNFRLPYQDFGFVSDRRIKTTF